MTLAQILREKGSAVISISPAQTVKEAADRLVAHNIGALLVLEGAEPRGIITERDILRLCSSDPAALGVRTVGEVMTTQLKIARPTDSVDDALALMTAAHIRHLPIVGDEGVAGMVSIGDLVKSQLEEREVTITHLTDYITGSRM
jgi:CBS domain-containing protein